MIPLPLRFGFPWLFQQGLHILAEGVVLPLLPLGLPIFRLQGGPPGGEPVHLGPEPFGGGQGYSVQAFQLSCRRLKQDDFALMPPEELLLVPGLAVFLIQGTELAIGGGVLHSEGQPLHFFLRCPEVRLHPGGGGRRPVAPLGQVLQTSDAMLRQEVQRFRRPLQVLDGCPMLVTGALLGLDITKIPLGYHLTIGSGRLRKIMDENIESVEGFIAHQFPDFVASVTAPIVMVIILLAVDWRFGLASLVGIVLAFVAEFIGFGSGEMKENMGKYCDEFVREMPDGYQTVLGENGSTLSGGERQRISIARALLKNAPIILLDEATASLDPENEVLVQKAIAKLVEGKTVIMIAHRLRTVVDADQILVLDNGRLVEHGTHDELMKKNGLYHKLFHIQQESLGWAV